MLCSAALLAGDVAAQQPAPDPQPSSEVMLSDEERQKCIDSFSKAQTHRMMGDLRAARATVQGCTITKCGRLAPECAAMERQLTDDIPTVIVKVRDHEGNDVTDAQVILGGRVQDFSAGLAVEMNPGNFLLVVQRPGLEPINKTIVLAAREKNREIVIEFPAPAEKTPAVRPAPSTTAPGNWSAPPPDPNSAPDAPAPKGGVSPLVPIGFALGGAGVVVFAVAGGVALSRQSELSDQCPDDQCPADLEGDIDDALLAARVATAGLVMTGLGAALGIVGLILSDFGGADADAGADAAASRELTPLVGPGYLGLRGRF